MNSTKTSSESATIIGGGPAGLMAAEVLSNAGVQVDLYDAMPSLGRKFLMAGKGGLNITHAEPKVEFMARYGTSQDALTPFLESFDATALRNWAHGLGIDTFVGSSGRVFPSEMKAAPLLRTWLHRLREAGVRFHVRHRWLGITQKQNGYSLSFSTPEGAQEIDAQGLILALGGGSWAKLGSDGQWMPTLEKHEVKTAALRPANCGFDVQWTPHMREHFAGEPVKPVIASMIDAHCVRQERQGEFVITEQGIEGGLIYALSAHLRDAIEAHGSVTLYLDLLPSHSAERVLAEVSHPRGSRSLSSHLQSRLGLKGVRTALLYECLSREVMADPKQLAQSIKALPLTLNATRPIDEAISTAGGVSFDALDEHLMLRNLKGVFCAGEMLDWEAPTGGYLLTACFASGHAAGQSMLRYLKPV